MENHHTPVCLGGRNYSEEAVALTPAANLGKMGRGEKKGGTKTFFGKRGGNKGC